MERYLEEFPEGGHFKGKNFVFDQRVAISSTNPTIVGRCLGCQEPYDELSGSRICTVCRDLVLVCPRCSDSLLEYHCATHQPWAQHYFTFLQNYSAEELKAQLVGLQRLWDDSKGKKKRRLTLRKQIEKVRNEISTRDQLGDPPRSATRRCRTCGKASSQCDGLCFGFWRRDQPSSCDGAQTAGGHHGRATVH